MSADIRNLIAMGTSPYIDKCPKCGGEVAISMKDILENGKQIPCPVCGGIYVVEHSPEWDKELDKINPKLDHILDDTKK